MSVKLRLHRTGALSAACWRIVATDIHTKRDGKCIEILGVYDPRHDCEKINLERAKYWLSVGAKASDTVSAIIKRAETGKPFPARKAEAPKAAPAPRTLKSAEAPAEAAAEAAPAEAATEAQA